MSHTVRVVIIEDQRMVAEFFAAHCASLGLEVVAKCGTIAEGLAAVRRLRPRLLLLDFSLPDGNGLAFACELMSDLPELRIIGVSSQCDPWAMLQVQRLGLHGFVDKHEPRPEALTEVIRAVLANRIYYSAAVMETTTELRRNPKAFFRLLSEAEQHLLALVGESLNDDEIAAALGISPATVQSRRRSVMHKLGVHSTPKLISYAIVHGITRPERLNPP